VPHKNERIEFEMQIMKYRQLARQMATDPEESKRIRELVVELEQKLHAIDEQAARQAEFQVAQRQVLIWAA